MTSGSATPASAAIAAVASLQPGNYRAQTVGGGCIHHCYRVSHSQQSWFVKVATHPQGAAMLSAEADGLAALAAADCIRTPSVIALETDPSNACLVLEYLPLNNATGDAKLGRALAQLHEHTGPYFGWPRDNFLGLTPQPNLPTPDPVHFLAQQRLGYQLELARNDGLDHHVIEQGEQLLTELGQFYTDYRPQPSLLHGDLWQGNQACLNDGTPVTFDPAIHYGDREADLAMTELFGGFTSDFYAAYSEYTPIDPGYQTRRDLHQLYHVLNHCHLFGAAYTGHARRLIERLRGSLA